MSVLPRGMDWRLEYEVRGFDCGYGGPFRPLSLANFLQEAAGAHAARHGFGMGDLASAGRTWMLSRVDLRIEALPREGERVRVHTKPSGADRLFALRDLVMLGEGGRPLVRAVYAYLVIDLEARRPLRPERVFPAGLLGEKVHALGEPVLAAATIEGGRAEDCFRMRATGRHIDENGHVNNAHIMDWLVDAALGGPLGDGSAGPAGAGASSGPALGLLSFDRVRELRVDFVQELLRGEEFLLRRGPAASAAAGGGADGGGPARIAAEIVRGAETAARAELVLGD